MKLLFDQPIWYIFICVTISFCYAYILYYYKPNKDESSSRIIPALFSLRFLYTLVITLLLLNPVLSLFLSNSEKSTLTIAVDNSKSMLHSSDSSTFISEMNNMLKSIEKECGENFKIKKILFSDSTSPYKKRDLPNFKGESTNISNLIEKLDNNNDHGGNTAIIISDGINNLGASPLLLANNSSTKLFTIGTGREKMESDIKVEKIYYEPTVNTGSIVPIRALINASNLKGEKSFLLIKRDGSLISRVPLTINSDNFSKIITYDFKSDSTGVYEITFAIEKMPKELNIQNNTRKIVISSKDKRKQILLINKSPHPDLRSIKLALLKEKSYNLSYSSSYNISNIDKYSLIIAHSPSATELKNLNIYTNNKLIIEGNNGWQDNSNNEQAANTVILNNDFDLFNIDNELKLFEKAKPLYCSSSVFLLKERSNTLYLNKRNSCSIIYFDKEKRTKSGYIMGEGLWQWRNFDYITNNHTQNFDKLISKIISYLTADSNRKRFIVNYESTQRSGNKMVFNAQLFNKSYEPTNGSISIRITQPDKTVIESKFIRGADDFYTLMKKLYTPGKYSFSAKAETATENFTTRGSFFVKKESLELSSNTPNHYLLAEIAKSSGGEFHTQTDYRKVIEKINSIRAQRQLTYKNSYIALSENLIFLLFALTLMIAEWFLRRMFVNY